jgi:hypothetical protein
MITKDPKIRADWNEIFSYEIKNGELINYNAFHSDKTSASSSRIKESNGVLKGSFTPSDSTNMTKN